MIPHKFWTHPDLVKLLNVFNTGPAQG